MTNKQTHEVVIKSVFDDEEKVSIENQEDGGLKLSLANVSDIDEEATSNWLEHGLVVTEIDFKRDIVYVKNLSTTVRHYWNSVNLKRGV